MINLFYYCLKNPLFLVYFLIRFKILNFKLCLDDNRLQLKFITIFNL